MPLTDAEARNDTIPVRHIIDARDVRRIAGNVTRTTLLRWKQRPDFPQPIRRTGSGTELYDRAAIRAWLRANVGERAGDGTLTRGN